MHEFNLDPEVFSSRTVTTTWNTYTVNGPPSPDDLIELLKGKGNISMTSSEDHPEFLKFRDFLEKENFIEKGAGVNGDIVLKPFKLNGLLHQPRERFLCAPAFGVKLRLTKTK